MGSSRRDFLLKVAAGAAYVAPVVRTLAAPERLSAQANPSAKSGGKAGGKGKGPGLQSGSDIQFGPSAPWEQQP